MDIRYVTSDSATFLPTLTSSLPVQIEKKGHARQPSNATGDGANLSRRPSKRQQEKAPEGRPPHDVAAEDKTVPEGESRFTENV
jgi:hypothetical protein